MLPSRMTRRIIRALDYGAGKLLIEDSGPKHQRVGRRGEEEAYFHLAGDGLRGRRPQLVYAASFAVKLTLLAGIRIKMCFAL